MSTCRLGWRGKYYAPSYIVQTLVVYISYALMSMIEPNIFLSSSPSQSLSSQILLLLFLCFSLPWQNLWLKPLNEN